jgi:ankyrin repeat protein
MSRYLAIPLSLLLWAGVAVCSANDPDGTTPLHHAALRNDVAAVKTLLAGGASARAANRYGITPLFLACRNGSAEVVKLLLDAGAELNSTVSHGETMLMTAARTGDPQTVHLLIERGENVHAGESATGQTALMWAAAEGHTEAVRVLLDAGADLRARLESGFTPLLFAAREGHLDVIKVLLGAGADANDFVQPMKGAARVARGPRAGTSALQLAVTNAHYDLAAFLLESGADPNFAESGWTALHIITGVRKPGGGDNNPAPIGSGRTTSLDMVRKLKEHGADLNARMTKRISVGMTKLNTMGATPFFLAARTADAPLMKLLAELGADPLIPNADNSTPLMAVAGLGTRSPGEDAGTEAEVVEALEVALALGNDLNAVDNNGETAMHSAAYKNLPGAVETLAKNGADIAVWNRNNRFGWSPLRIAQGYRFGNYKPSAVTVAAIEKVLRAAGVPPAESTGGNRSDY